MSKKLSKELGKRSAKARGSIGDQIKDLKKQQQENWTHERHKQILALTRGLGIPDGRCSID